MNTIDPDDQDDFLTWLSIPLDAETRERLKRLANDCHQSPALIASSLLRDILKDDEDAHFGLPAEDPDDDEDAERANIIDMKSYFTH